MAEFGAEPVVVAEVVHERAPLGRIDVLRSRHQDARVGVDPENLGLDDQESPAGPESYVGDAGLHLERAFGDPWRPDQLRGFGPQAGGSELLLLKAEGALLVIGYRAAPGQRGEPFDGLSLGRRGHVDYQVVAVAQVLGGLPIGTQAKDDHLAERPGR